MLLTAVIHSCLSEIDFVWWVINWDSAVSIQIFPLATELLNGLTQNCLGAGSVTVEGMWCGSDTTQFCSAFLVKVLQSVSFDTCRAMEGSPISTESMSNTRKRGVIPGK